MNKHSSDLEWRIRRETKRIYANYGLVFTALYMPSLLIRAVFPPDREARWPDPTGIEFDRCYGVDTTGITPISELQISNPSWVYGFDYQAVEVFAIETLLDGLGIDYTASVFVDLGAGKGRVVMIASKLPFRRLIGVEISPDLAKQALHNFVQFERAGGNARERSMVIGDCAAYEFPHEPLVIFLYNPFGAKIMTQVIENLLQSLARAPRRVNVVYFRPELAELWGNAPGFFLVRATARYRIYEFRPTVAENLSA